MPDLLIVAVLAIVWWVPTFRALTHLQQRLGRVPRITFWRWSAILCIPILGALLYYRRGQAQVEKAAADTKGGRAGRPGRGGAGA